MASAAKKRKADRDAAAAVAQAPNVPPAIFYTLETKAELDLIEEHRKEYELALSKMRSLHYVLTNSVRAAHAKRAHGGFPCPEAVFAGIDCEEVEFEFDEDKFYVVDKRLGVVWNDPEEIQLSLSPVHVGYWSQNSGTGSGIRLK